MVFVAGRVGNKNITISERIKKVDQKQIERTISEKFVMIEIVSHKDKPGGDVCTQPILLSNLSVARCPRCGSCFQPRLKTETVNGVLQFVIELNRVDTDKMKPAWFWTSENTGDAGIGRA